MVSDRRTTKAIGNMDAEHEKKKLLTQNMHVIDKNSFGFKQFIELISAARRQKDQEGLEGKDR